MSDVHEDSKFPTVWIADGSRIGDKSWPLRRCETRAARISKRSPVARPDISGSPRINDELHEHHPFCVEEKQNLVQPIDDLRRFISAGRFEITFFERAKCPGIDQDTDEPMEAATTPLHD